MNELTKKMVEERARRLFGKFYGYYKANESDNIIGDFNSHLKRELWINLATYTLASELKAKLEGMEWGECNCSVLFFTCGLCEAKDKITEQLKDLGEVL